jgi:hypothetical protein
VFIYLTVAMIYSPAVAPWSVWIGHVRALVPLRGTSAILLHGQTTKTGSRIKGQFAANDVTLHETDLTREFCQLSYVLNFVVHAK